MNRRNKAIRDSACNTESLEVVGFGVLRMLVGLWR